MNKIEVTFWFFSGFFFAMAIVAWILLGRRLNAHLNGERPALARKPQEKKAQRVDPGTYNRSRPHTPEQTRPAPPQGPPEQGYLNHHRRRPGRRY